MKALLLIAHGSRREASNDEVRALARTLADQIGDGFGSVVPAFLELAEPSISSGVAECIRQGATDIHAIPYFLAAGRHVAHDIPEELDQAGREHPEVSISVSPYLGQHPMITQLLLGLAQQEQSATDAA